MRRLAIIGASGHGKVVADAAERAGWDAITFFDDGIAAGTPVGARAVEGTTADLIARGREFTGAVVAVGVNAVRLAVQARLVSARLPIATIVHPGAIVSASASIGAGSVVFAGAVVNAEARLGAACIVNTAASVDHECRLADGVHVCPGAHLGGDVEVGEGTQIGIGAVVRQCVRIGAGVTVGAGAAVVGDVADGLTVVGVPARPLGAKAGAPDRAPRGVD